MDIRGTVNSAIKFVTDSLPETNLLSTLDSTINGLYDSMCLVPGEEGCAQHFFSKKTITDNSVVLGSVAVGTIASLALAYALSSSKKVEQKA